LATGYGRRLPNQERALSPFTDCRSVTPAANMASSVEDLARFAMLQFRSEPPGGTQILAGSSLREMQRVHWLNADWSAGRGLGFYVWRKNGKTLAGHGGALQGYRTEFQVCPEDKIGVIVLTNADDGNPLMYIDKAFQWVTPALVAAVRPSPASEIDPAWKQYTGKYRTVWNDIEVLLLDSGLVLIDPSLPDPQLVMTKLTPVSTHVFRMEAADTITMILALFGLSMPAFWFGLLMIYFFGVQLRWFPVMGTGSLRHLVMPALTLGLIASTIQARVTRSSMIEVLNSDYIRTARAKGLSKATVVLRHGLKNALIPTVTVLGLQVGGLLGGAFIIETVFAWHGIGALAVRAISQRDFPVIQGVIVVVATTYVLVNLLVDLIYRFLDPRISYE
jgi:hypothetical protein